jgi:uncharacterized protein (TIGR02001 family)
MKKTLLAVTLAALTSGAATTALAADPKAPEPDFEISGNFALVSDYRFRGVTQTGEKPAAQGGFDFSHKSGFYLGTWASNVSQWANAGGSMEIDLYGGFRGTLPTGEIGYDIGIIDYQYPGNTANPKNGSREWYVGLSKGPISYKFSRTTGNWFGINSNSSGSTYHDLNANFGLNDQVTFTAHVGRQDIKGTHTFNPDFTDYSVGVSVALPDDYTAGVKFTTVDLKDSRSNSSATGAWFFAAGSGLANDAIVLSLSKTF